MPGVETADLLEVAVVWEPGLADVYGEAPSGAAYEVPCRWQETDAEAGAEADRGQDVTLATAVRLPVGATVRRGPIEEATAAGGMLRVISCAEVRDIKGRQARFTSRLGMSPEV